MKFLIAAFGISLSFWGVDVSESPPTSSAVIPSDAVEDSNGGSQQFLDEVEMDGPQPPGLTCAEMGWYEAGDGDLCSADCGHDCRKKQWCGTGWCQPWPYYCWKCS